MPVDDPKRDDVNAFLESLKAKDVRLALEGGKLRVNAPKGALSDELREGIVARRDRILEVLRTNAAAIRGGLRPVARTPPLPLSSAQQRLWFLDRVQPGPQYNIGLTIRLRGPLDAELLRRALDALVARQESLRTRYDERDGAPEVSILAPFPAQLDLVDVSHLPEGEREQEALTTCAARLRAPFDLASGHLAAFRLVRLDRDDHFLTVAIHHVAADGWSLVVTVREIVARYGALSTARSAEPPPLPIAYVDYATWEREELHSGRMAKHLSYWTQQLAGAPETLELPTDRPRPPALSFRGRRLQRAFDLGLAASLRQLAQEHQATFFMTLIAAWQVLLHRYSGEPDIVVGSPMVNRDHSALEALVGCFVNNIVIRSHLDENPRFVDFLAQVKETTLEAFEHRELPFEVVVDGLKQSRSADHTPVFQVLFTLHSFPIGFSPPPGLEVRIVDEVPWESARFDLAVEIAEYDGKFAVSYEYASDLFDEATVARMHARYERILQEIVVRSDTRIRDIPLRTPEEELLFQTWNDTAQEHDRAACIHQLLEARARETPDAVAVVAGEEKLTYRELDERANRLARLLVARGVTPGSLVAVCVERTVAIPIALAAILKAGAAYVPLDPIFPADRLGYMLEDSGAVAVVTLARLASLFPGTSAKLIALDEAAAELAALPSSAPPVDVRADARAYVIYTSGSTGRPKGVEIEHRNVVAFLDAMRVEPGISAGDVLLAVTTLSFDIAGLELWLPLVVGARVVIASRAETIDGEALANLLQQHGVTMMQATPATWRLLVESGWTGKRDLKALCGGEQMPRDLAALLVSHTGELWNMYGPTETTIWSTIARISDAAVVTIGRPIKNTRVYVLEPSGAVAPIGIAGELCIGGEGVARGYHARPELTAEKFVSLTLPDGRVERVYRTGDVVRFRADGSLAFMGRRDQQIKLRGYRIELGEIEALLATDPAVSTCAVIVREDEPGDQRLVGYVVARAGFDGEAARVRLRTKLPEYMVPNLFIELEALPLTPNRKIDRKALPAPDRAAAAPAASETSEVMMSPSERRVAKIWRGVLRLEHVGLHANFFDVGGHSLLLTKLHALLKREFETDLRVVDLFQSTTIAAQAARLATSAPKDAAIDRARARAAKQGHG